MTSVMTSTKNQWIDVHTHLNMLEEQPDHAVQEALSAGVERMITIGTCPDDHPLVVKLAEQFDPFVYCTLGVHPHDAELFTPATEEFMVAHYAHPRVVAVAEIGLDYFYDNAPREVQKKAFRRQLELSLEHNLPVQIHTRDAEQDTVEILEEFSGKITGLLHCFTGSAWLAEQALRLGLNVSFSGIVTFKNATELREVVNSVPLDRLHVETDAPFLTPVPFRGKKNTPAMVVHTARLVSEVKGVSLEELSRQTNENALNLFTKIKWNERSHNG